jgi:hypothetical protein
MTDPATVRFTLIQKVRALLVAGVVAWLLSLAAMYGSAHLFDFIQRDLAGPPPAIPELDNAIGWTLLGAVYLGLPAAFIVVLAFGFPVMRHAEKTGATTFRDAAVAGLICGAIVGAAIALGLVLVQRPDESGALMKPLEWAKIVADFLATLVTGLLTGISARLAAGRPKAPARSA